jgi:hypothetical protein
VCGGVYHYVCFLGLALEKELTHVSGTAVSMQIAVLGRFLAGIGSSGMTDLISVLIVGKDCTGYRYQVHY